VTAIAIRHTMRFVVHAIDVFERRTRHAIGLLGNVGRAADFDRRPGHEAPDG